MHRRFLRPEFLFALCFLLFGAAILPAQTDPNRPTAEKLAAEAEELFAKNTPEDREKAFPKFAAAAEIWERLGDDENHIKALNKLNDISYFRSDYRQCIGYSSKILPLAQKIGNKNLEGGVLGNIGFYHHLLGESRKGLEFLEKSAEILAGIGEKQRESITLTNIGLIYYDLGEIRRTLDFFDRSLALKRETGDRRGEGIILTNLGYVSSDGGDKRKALEYYEKAYAITLETKDQRTQGTLLSNIGSVYQDFSEFQKAFDHYLQSLELRRQIGDRFGEAVVMQNIASLYRTLGDFENALNFMNRALEIYQKGGFRREEALAFSSVGAIYKSVGDSTKALEFFQKALEIQKALDNKTGYSGILGNIGTVYLENAEPQKALEHFEQALKFAEETNDAASAGGTLVLLARGYEKLDKPQAAEANFNRALTVQREIGLPFETADTLYHFARFEAQRGSRAAALEKIGETLEIVENLRNSIASQNLRAGFFAEQQKYYDFYISLLAAEHRRAPDKGFGARALEASEKARARSLLDSLGESRRDIRAQIPSELAAEERLLRQTINAKDFQRVEALKAKAGEKAAVFEKELAEAFRRYEELQTRIRRASPQFASLNNPEPLDLGEIQTQVLDEKTVLLEYFLGEERSFLFFVTKTGLEIVELPKRETIESEVRRAVENLKARAAEVPDETAAQRAARLKKSDAEAEKGLVQMSRTLIAPVAGKIQNKRLLIVASGVLQYLPFGALKIQNPSSSAFLIEKNEIVNLPSASVVPLLRQMKPGGAARAKNLVSILADPVFSPSDLRLKTISKKSAEPDTVAVMRDARIIAPNLRSDFSRLRFSRTEAEAISALAQSDQRFVALDFAANLAAATGDNLQNSRLVHLATHGIVNSQFPELSSIVLSTVDENGSPREGFLRLQDVYNLRLEAELVVLSACETALGKEIKGEGIVGLTRGFMYAGAPRVVASLWRVEDRATADLMKRFYERMLRENLPPAAALREAQIAMLKEKTSAHPFYWAGFTLQGDWR